MVTKRFWGLIFGLLVTLTGLALPMIAGWLHSAKVVQSYEESALSLTSATTTRLLPVTQRSCANCCNLKESNCARTLDKVVFATSHNAMSSSKDQWVQPNNLHSVESALNAGIRALMLDLYYRFPVNATAAQKEIPTPVHLCHGVCTIGYSYLNDTLATIKEFLDAHPREVLVLIFEQYVASSSVVDELTTAGLTGYLGYTHPGPSTPWPTMSQLLAQGNRLLVLSNRLPTYTGEPSIPTANLQPTYASMGAGISGWHHSSAYRSETAYTYKTLEAMQADCTLLFGLPGGGVAALSQTAPFGGEQHRLTIMNHFMSTPTPCERCAEDANTADVIQARHTACRAAWKHAVNFIAVDFWSIGNTITVVNDLNN